MKHKKKKERIRGAYVVRRILPAVDDLEGNMIHFKYFPQDLPSEWDKEEQARARAKRRGETYFNPEYDTRKSQKDPDRAPENRSREQITRGRKDLRSGRIR